jgi:hypothetical protein
MMYYCKRYQTMCGMVDPNDGMCAALAGRCPHGDDDHEAYYLEDYGEDR